MKKSIIALLLSISYSLFGQEMAPNAKIYVAGHRGLAGSAIVRQLQAQGYTNIVTRTHSELELKDKRSVDAFFAKEQPEYVFLAAAKVGGIKANMDEPAEFIYDNILIQTHVIDAAYRNGVKKLVFLGSSCIYPKEAQQPIAESSLLTGPLEPTNDAYAVAKIAGIKMCQAYNAQYGTRYISCMPTNLYGPNDNFDPISSHVLPAMIMKFSKAKAEQAPSLTLWGSGRPLREFLHVDDMARGAIHLMNFYEGDEIVNLGCGSDVTIKDLAYKIKEAVGYKGEIIFDTSMPDGMYRKVLNVDKITALGWKPEVSLEGGIAETVAWYRENRQNLSYARGLIEKSK